MFQVSPYCKSSFSIHVIEDPPSLRERVVSYIQTFWTRCRNSYALQASCFFKVAKERLTLGQRFRSIVFLPTLTTNEVLITDHKIMQFFLEKERNGELLFGGTIATVSQQVIGDNLLSYGKHQHLGVKKALKPLAFKPKIEALMPSVEAFLSDMTRLSDICKTLPSFVLEASFSFWFGQKIDGNRWLAVANYLLENPTDAVVQRQWHEEVLSIAQVCGLPETLTEEERVNFIKLLCFGGTDTVPPFVECLFWLLSQDQHLQETIYQLLPAKASEFFSFIQQDKTLEKFYREGLRFFPATFDQQRVLKKSVVVDNMVLPAGSILHLLHFFANRDEKHFPGDPEQFNLEREPHAHYALSFGPTQCLGRTMAALFIKTLIAKTVAQYRWTSDRQEATFIGTTTLRLDPRPNFIFTKREEYTCVL